MELKLNLEEPFLIMKYKKKYRISKAILQNEIIKDMAKSYLVVNEVEDATLY